MMNEEAETMQQPIPPYYGNPSQENSTIAEMRWKDNDLVTFIEQELGGYVTIINTDGTIKKVRTSQFRPKINDEGLQGLISYLRSHINSLLVLSNLDENKAYVLIRIQLLELAKWLAYNQERFQIQKGDMSLITSLVRPIVVAQIYRAVEGHETINFHTQALEHNVQQHSTMNNAQSGNWWPFSRGGRR